MGPNRRARRERAARAAEDLQALASSVAKWIDEVPGLPAVYLFGSRVRGDHRPDSDVDIRVYLAKRIQPLPNGSQDSIVTLRGPAVACRNQLDAIIIHRACVATTVIGGQLAGGGPISGFP